MRVLWTARRSNQSILKEINIEYSLEGLMLKLRYFCHLMQRTNSLEMAPMMRKFEYRKRIGVTEDETVRWQHRHNGHEFEQTPVVSAGQGSLEHCSPWGHKESDRTE